MPINFNDVSHTYSPGTPLECRAVDNVSFTVPDGSFLAIVGRTGSGKSTLLRMMNGLLVPTQGSVSVDGIATMAVKGEDLKRIRAKVGVVFQYPEHQLFEETVRLDVAFGPSNFGHSGQELDDIVDGSLGLVGLDPGIYSSRSPFELSGGEMRRVALAGVLAMRPKYLVLDEPTAGLDPGGSRDLLHLLDSLHSTGMTVIMVTHNLDDVAGHCSHIIGVMDGGKAIDASPREFLGDPASVCGLGLLPTESVLLMDDLKRKGFHVGGKPVTVDEATGAILKIVTGRGTDA